MQTQYAQLKQRRQELARLIDARVATPEQRAEFAQIRKQIRANLPTLDQVYATMRAPRFFPRLKKDADQLGLFGGAQEVKPTAKAKQRKKLQESWGQQLGLFGETTQLTPKTKKRGLTPKAPGKEAKEGDTRINRAGNKEVLRGGRWRRVDKPQPQQQGLAIIQDEPAPQQLKPKAEPVKPQSTSVDSEQKAEGEQEAAIAPTAPVKPAPSRPPASPKKPKPALDDLLPGSGMTEAELDREIAQVSAEVERLNGGPVEPQLGINADYETARGQKTRLAINEKVKELLKRGTPYSKEEQTILAKYSGKGGITADEGSLSEYYTRSDVAEFVTGQLAKFGFKGGTVWEPSCGHGVFLQQFKDQPGVLPVGIEMDETSSAVAAVLNPHAEVAQSTRFERFLLDNPEAQADAIVGNVPFGTRTVDRDLKASRYKLEKWKDNGDFFVDECLERLKPNGVMSIVVPHGIVSGSTHQRLREELVKKGRCLGAYRLPSDAFKHSGTQTITDVLVFQKHPDSVLNAIASGDHLAIDLTRDDDFIQGKYFERNPQHILGEVREVQRGFREGFTVDGDTATAIQNAPELSPAVTYEGLDVGTPAAPPREGETRYINGRLYRLEGNPLRWHLVDAEEHPEAARLGGDENLVGAYGVDSTEAAEARLSDPGQRVLIAPEHLSAYASMAGRTLSGAEAAMLRDAQAALKHAGSSADRAKVAHAMLLAGHIKHLQQSGAADDIQLEQALAMLQQYREQYGNPATDKDLSAIATQFTQLLNLQGAFDESGKVSDYFSNHAAVMEQAKRSHSEAGAAMLEAFRAGGGEPVLLDTVRLHFEGEISDDDLEAALVADPTVGYMGGAYMPLNRLLVGNGFNLMDALMMEAESLPEGSPLRRKLEEQIDTIRSRLEPRALEDMTTPFWAVGSWIPVEALNEFMADRGYDDFEVKFSEKGWWNSGPSWGTAEDVVTVMNRGRISHGSKTKEAKDAIAALENDFRDWLAASDYRIQVEEAYNVAYNGDLPVEHSGEELKIGLFEEHDGDAEKGIRSKKKHDYQNSTIRQMAEQGRGIIALGVGMGKTMTSIGLALHLKELGRAKKPTFVVPKSVLANWVREIDFWAPNANVMILGQTQMFWQNGEPAWEVPGHKVKTKGGNPATDKNGNFLLIRNDDKTLIAMSPEEVKKRSSLAFSDDDRATKERKMQQLAQNSYDIVLMSEPVFQDIALHPEKESEYLEDLARNGSHINPDAKNTHKELERLETAKRKLAERTGDKTENITFETLGIDCLFHDEAHHVKNLFGTQRTGDVAFLSQATSNRALDFYYKARYIREQNNNQNVYLLTATPTTNNPLEAFNMLQHVCPEEFEKRGINNVDDFLSMFGKIESVTVPGVDLEMTEKNGLVGFKNLKDLRKLFNKYCRMQSAKDVGLPIPEELTQDHYVDMSPAQKEIYDDLKQRAKTLMEKGGEGGEGEDHIFSVISDMDKAAIDLGYYQAAKSVHAQDVDPELGGGSPKIDSAVNNVLSSLKANGGKQIVFCDAIQLHDELKRRLVAAGYPEDQIQIVNAGTAKSSSDRQKISQAYNDGRTTLVIGNTATMGEGMNFQIGTTDIHHLTTPWTPAAIEQRNGRGVRQGNELEGVGCHYYHAKGSFDGYRKGVIERKRGWIDDLWKGDNDEADNKNTGALSMDEISIMMADDPEEARRQMEANQELQMARHKEKMTRESLKVFGQIQTMKLALSKMSPEKRNSDAGRQLEARMRQRTEALSRNQYFPHKDLLTGSEAAYVGTNGTVLRVGDHVRKSDGSVYRIDAVDLQSNKLRATNVSGSDYNPARIDKEPKEFDFKAIGNTRSHAGVSPVAFDTNAHGERLMEKLRSYSEISSFDADFVNANRGRILDKVMNGYDSIPYLDSSGMVKQAKPSDLPENAQVLFPHDGEALEHTLKTMAHPDAEAEWRYHSIVENLTGQTWHNQRKDLAPRIEAYKAQYKALTEQGPKEGDTRTNDAGHQEVLRNGRWQRVPDTVAIASEVELDTNTRANVRRQVELAMQQGITAEPEIRRMINNATGHLPQEKRQQVADHFVSGLVQQGVAVAGQTYHRVEDRDALRAVIGESIPNGASPTATNRLVRAMQSMMDDDGNFDVAEMREELTDLIEMNSGEGRLATGGASPSDLADAIISRIGGQSTDVNLPEAESTPAIAPPDPVAARVAAQTEESAKPHPDPVGAISRAFMLLLDDDQDGASERNDVGFNGMHTPYRYRNGMRTVNNEFVASMVERVQDGQTLTPNQLKASLNLLTTYRKQLEKNGLALPTTEDLEQVIKEMPAPAVKASLKQTRHAKKGIDLHVVAMDERVDRDTYERLNAQAKRLGGYYSSYSKMGAIPGFQFTDREAAEKMMDYAYTLNKSAKTYSLGQTPYTLKPVGGLLKLVKGSAPKLNVRLLTLSGSIA